MRLVSDQLGLVLLAGVLTKLDIMDRGTNAVPILKNLVVPLRLGYIGIVNRSQEDINENRNIADARKNEDTFFKGRLDYRDVSAHCGIQNLARRLNRYSKKANVLEL